MPAPLPAPTVAAQLSLTHPAPDGSAGVGRHPQHPQSPQSPARGCSRRGGRLGHPECHPAAVTELPQPRAPLGLGPAAGGGAGGFGGVSHTNLYLQGFEQFGREFPSPEIREEKRCGTEGERQSWQQQRPRHPRGTPGTPAAGSGAGSSGRPCQGRTNTRLSSVPSVPHQKRQNEARKSSSPVVPDRKSVV